MHCGFVIAALSESSTLVLNRFSPKWKNPGFSGLESFCQREKNWAGNVFGLSVVRQWGYYVSCVFWSDNE